MMNATDTRTKNMNPRSAADVTSRSRRLHGLPGLDNNTYIVPDSDRVLTLGRDNNTLILNGDRNLIHITADNSTVLVNGINNTVHLEGSYNDVAVNGSGTQLFVYDDTNRLNLADSNARVIDLAAFTAGVGRPVASAAPAPLAPAPRRLLSLTGPQGSFVPPFARAAKSLPAADLTYVSGMAASPTLGVLALLLTGIAWGVRRFYNVSR